MRTRLILLCTFLAACGGRISPPESDDSSEEMEPDSGPPNAPNTHSASPDSGKTESGEECNVLVEWEGECRIVRISCEGKMEEVEVHCPPVRPDGPPGNPDPGPR